MTLAVQDTNDPGLRSRIVAAIKDVDCRETKTLLRDILKVMEGPPSLEWMRDAYKISPAELKVIELLVSGMTHKQISEATGKKATTVAAQIYSAYKKMRVSNMAEFTALILQEGRSRL